MNALEKLKRTAPLDIIPLVLEVEKMYLEAANKLGKKKTRENELASKLANSRRLANKFAAIIGYQNISEEDKRRLQEYSDKRSKK
jgi:hypothetical protein